MSSPKFGMNGLQVNLSAVDVRVTEVKSPFPLFVLDWLNNSDELESMEIRLSDFYHEGRFSTVLANFKFDNMARFLHWYESPKTQEVVAVLREMTKQKRLDIEILTSRSEDTFKEKKTRLPSVQSNPVPVIPSRVPQQSASAAAASQQEELTKVRPLVAEEQNGSEPEKDKHDKVEHATAFTQRYF